jgi:hypothetical protein
MLDTIIGLVARVDVVLYFLSGLGFLLGLRGLSMARRLRREAVFGLEKEAARRTRRRALSTLFSMLLLAASVYLLTDIVQPTLQEMPVAGGDLTITPTPLASPEQAATPRPLLFPTVTPTFGILAPGEEAVEAAPGGAGEEGGCELIGVTITSPIPGEVVAGQVGVTGEANILNFAAYKFEINGPSTGGAWATMGTFTTPVASGQLGTWDATSLEPGAYRLRLVVFDTEGNTPQPCVVPLTIAEPGARPLPTGTPPSP